MSMELDGIVAKLTALRDEREQEKARRLYYQNIVYEVCLTLDATSNQDIICGNVDTPTTYVQDWVKALRERLTAQEQELQNLRIALSSANLNLAAAEKERDEARKDAAEWELDCTTAEAGEKRMAAERDAARAEAATYRALMPEVRRVVQMTAEWVVPQHLGGLNASDWFAKHGEWQAFGHSAIALLAKLPAEDKPATAEPKRVREWRYEENGYWAEYRSGGRDGRVQRRSQDCPQWYDDIQTIADMEEHVRTNPRYRETTPQPAPAPVAGNVPLTLVGPASLNGKKVWLKHDGSGQTAVEVRA
jgi:hypothetical protein